MPSGTNEGATVPRLLVVMEAGPLSNLVTFVLDHGRYERRKVHTVAEAETAIRSWQPHLAVVDLELEGGKGLELIRREMGGGRRLPVIALARRGDMKSKLAAYERGVDDILTVPFAPEELVARALGLMRRVYEVSIDFVPAVRIGELTLDLLEREVHADRQRLKLTSLELALLYLLAANPGEVLTREMILNSLWGDDFAAGSNVVDRHVRNLRVKLRDDWRRPRYVATVAGTGYRFLPGTAAIKTR